MNSKTISVSYAASILILVFSFFMALISLLSHDMPPATKAVQDAENFNTAVSGLGGFIAGDIGLAGSLFIKRKIIISRALIICSAALCLVYALIVDYINESFIFLIIFSVPIILLIAAFVLSFIPERQNNKTNEYL